MLRPLGLHSLHKNVKNGVSVYLEGLLKLSYHWLNFVKEVWALKETEKPGPK